MSGSLRRILEPAVAVLTAILASACGSNPGEDLRAGQGHSAVGREAAKDKPWEKKTEQERWQHAEDVLVKPHQAIPENFHLKPYPRSRVVYAHRYQTLKGPQDMVLMSSPDKQENIARFYSQDLCQEGWKLKSREGNTAYIREIWTRDGKETEVRVLPSPKDSERHVQLLVGPPGVE